MDKQKASRPGCIYNIENTDLEIGVSCISYINDNILAHIDVLALLAHFRGYALTFYNRMTGPRSAVGNVSGYRCVSDCRSRGREFDPGPVPYFRGD